MSLNRNEQQLFEYLEANRDERQFWEQKVREFDAKLPNRPEAAHRIERELWRYYVERSAVVPIFKHAVERDGLRRISLQNLAEYLLRLWVPPRARKPSQG